MSDLNLTVGITLKDEFSIGIKQIDDNIDHVTGSMRSMSTVISVTSTKLDQLRGKTDAAAESFARLKERGEALQSRGLGMAQKGMAVLGVAVKPAFSAMDFEAGLSELSGITDMSVQELKNKYGDQILSLAAEIGQSEGTVVKAMYQAISAGVAADDSIGFLRQSGKAAVGGVSDILTTTNLGTSVKNAFGVSDDSMNMVWDVMFQTIRSGKTDMAQIASGFDLLGTSVKGTGVSIQNVQASVAQLTLSGSRTNEAYEKVGNTIAALADPTDSARKAFNQLGVSINSETLQKNDLVGTLGIIADKVEKLPFDQQVKYINRIFGDNKSRDFFKEFMVNRDAYSGMVNSMTTSTGAAGEAANKMMSTSGFAWNQLKQELRNVYLDLGDKLLPTMHTGIEYGRDFAASIGELVKAHPKLATGIMLTVAGTGALMTVIGGISYVIGTAMKGFGKFGSVLLGVRDGWEKIAGSYGKFKKLGIVSDADAINRDFKVLTSTQSDATKSSSLLVPVLKKIASMMGGVFASGFRIGVTALRAVGVAFRVMGAAFMSNPLGLAIAAIAVGAVLLIKYWKPISGFFKGMFSGIKQTVASIMPQLKAAGSAFMSMLSPVITPLRTVFRLIKSLFKPVNDVGGAAENLGVKWGRIIGGMLNIVLGLPVKMFQAGANIVKSIVGGIQSMTESPVKAVTGVVQKIRNLLPFSPAKSGPLKDIHRVKLIETVADGVKPDSLVGKVNNVMSAVRPKLDGKSMMNPSSAMTRKNLNAGQAAQKSGSSGSPVTINYSPVVTVQGGEDVRSQIMSVLKGHATELVRLLSSQTAQKARLEY